MLPTFLVIGAQKAATTTLDTHLRQHPDIVMPSGVKETNFLIDEGRWHRGQSWYESLYADAGDARHRGDVSPGYTMWPVFRHAPERAARLIPSARLIYVIRHPVDRMVSAWVQAVTNGLEHREITDALLRGAQYTWTSSYGAQLAQWLEHFDREQLLVVRSDSLSTEYGSTIDAILEHLDLPTGWRPATVNERMNESGGKRVPRQATRQLVRAAKASGRQRLARRIGSRRGWLTRPLTEEDTRLAPDVREALTASFRADLTLLRSLVGPDLDLWGLA